MKKSLVSLMAAGALFVCLQATAAEPKEKATMDTCNTLSADFDAAAKANPNAPKLAAASKRRDHAMAECKAGKYDTGAKALHAALSQIGAKVPSNQ